MDAATRERLLTTIDAALSRGPHSKIERVRLLDLWWRVATDGRRDGATLGRTDAEFLAYVLGGVARRTVVVSAAFRMTAMALRASGSLLKGA